MIPLVLVTWNDAWQDTDNFTTAHGIVSTHAPLKVETLGWLVRDDTVGISVANEQSMEDGVPTFRGRTFIPRAMVVTVTHYTLTKKRKLKCAEPSSPASSS